MAKASTTGRRRAPRRRKAGEAEPGPASAAREDGTSRWEWAVAAAGAVILAAILAVLVYEGVSRTGGAHPDIVAHAEPAVALQAGGFLVPIRVENGGDATGANVAVRGALTAPDGAVVEESTVRFDFIAQHSSEGGGLYFTADPNRHRLVLRIEGYADP